MLRALNRPRRVLLTVDAVGGIWRHACDLVGQLDREGVACLVVGSGPVPSAQLVSETEGWRQSMLQWTSHPLDWMTEDQATLDAARSDLEQRARDWHADIVHVNMPSQAAGLRADLRVVAMSHSCRATWWQATRSGQPPAAWRPGIERTQRGLARADRVLAPSQAHARALRQAYGPIERITVVHNAILDHGPAGEDRNRVILAAGRWWDDAKNLAALDQAGARCAWPIVIAGPMAGPDGSTRTAGNVVALGALDHASLRRRMARAAIFTSASVYEPFGLAVLEAASHGCALVLADIPSFRELWHDAAFFADPRCGAGFGAALDRLAGNDNERRRLGEAARARSADFAPARQRDGVLEAYADCLAV